MSSSDIVSSAVEATFNATSTMADSMKDMYLQLSGFKSGNQLELLSMSGWSKTQMVTFYTVVLLGVELMSYGVMNFKHVTAARIPMRGSHLDTFTTKDWSFVIFNRLSIPLMFFHLSSFLVSCHPAFVPASASGASQHVQWGINTMTFANTVGSFVGFFLIYDLMYTMFHRFLHVRGVYKYVHKHHHRQHAPSRGNVDAVNTHPFEYLVGEYLHLAVVMLIPCHVSAVLAFVLFGGILASLNHTRFDWGFLGVYEVHHHDTHHRLPQTNYGQYTMFWDFLTGSFRKFEPVEDKTQDKKAE